MQIVVSPQVRLRLAVAGVGLAIIYDQSVRAHIDAGQLSAVLEAYCQPFPGYYLYFPRRRYRSAALQAFIDFVRSKVRR